MAMSRKEMLRRWMLEWDLTYSDFAKRMPPCWLWEFRKPFCLPSRRKR